jgi:transposase
VGQGSTSSVRYRRAMMLLASAGGNRVPLIAQLVQADEDTVRDVIHRFNEIGLACLDPRWAGGRPRLLIRDDEDFVVQTAITRPTKLSQPFTRWSLRKLVAYLRKVHGRLGLGRARTSRLKSISSGRPDGAAPIYVIMDNLSAHKGADIRRWARRNQVELCFTPTYASWANPIEAHFGPLRQFTIASSNYPNHTVQKTRALLAYLGWRNANARHRDVLAAERKERARIRSEKGIRWGGGPLVAAA